MIKFSAKYAHWPLLINNLVQLPSVFRIAVHIFSPFEKLLWFCFDFIISFHGLSFQSLSQWCSSLKTTEYFCHVYYFLFWPTQRILEVLEQWWRLLNRREHPRLKWAPKMFLACYSPSTNLYHIIISGAN